jgi:serine/threonine protein kinase
VLGVVIGNYRIVRKLGEGGMGTVYLGEHTLLGRKAAIKVLLTSLSARADIVNRFFNEARAATSINDPGIVQIFDFGFHTDGSAFIVMEFLEGETLDARLHKLGRLAVVDALRITRQVASSLYAAHGLRIIHRDLKPENIFLVRDQEVSTGERAKILDFGIAKLSDDHPGKIKTHTGALMGTPIYMSPEQCRGAGDLDHRSDIYALGCVLFHLLVGRPPFDGDGMGEIIAAHLREPPPAPSSRAPDLPPEIDALVLYCLAKDPSQRFQDMAELAAAIGQVLPYVTAPGAPGSVPPPYHAGGTPPPGWPRTSPGTPEGYTPLHGTPPPASGRTPTTLGTSAGQVATAAPPRKTGWLIVGAVAIAGAGGAAIALGLRDHPRTAVAAPPPVIISPDAAPVVSAPPPDAPAMPAIVSVPDAAPPDAAPPPDASKRTHPSTKTRPPRDPKAPPPPCDTSIDFDCDGIPDTR